MNRRLHLVLAVLLAALLEALGAWIIGATVPGDMLALGLCILVGVVIGMCVVAYWEEVIDGPRSVTSASSVQAPLDGAELGFQPGERDRDLRVEHVLRCVDATGLIDEDRELVEHVLNDGNVVPFAHRVRQADEALGDSVDSGLVGRRELGCIVGHPRTLAARDREE